MKKTARKTTSLGEFSQLTERGEHLWLKAKTATPNIHCLSNLMDNITFDS